MARVKVEKEALMQQLAEQIHFLQTSALDYDGGSQIEAKRMAVSLRVLLHDTTSSKSLLGQLGYKRKMKFFETSVPYDEKNLLTHHGLVGLSIGMGSGVYYPFLDDSKVRNLAYFKDWWNEIIIKDTKGNLIRRKQLIKYIANQDGGAHVDFELDETYDGLKNRNTIGWIMGNEDSNNGKPLDNDVCYASIRQITFEFLQSIYKFKPNAFKDIYF